MAKDFHLTILALLAIPISGKIIKNCLENLVYNICAIVYSIT